MQEIFDTFNFSFEKLYNIADIKTKKRINTYISEWKEKGLLTGFFGMLAKKIYNRNRVKNSEILELLIYSAYIEEQSKLNETELNVFKDVANYYYNEGINEVQTANRKQKNYSVIPDAIFLALLDIPNSKGYVWKQYIEAIIKFNADQIFRQTLINIQQGKELKIDSDTYQNIIKKQQNAKLNINGEKISGDVDLTLIGINNQAKIEGIYSFDDKAKVKFVAVHDDRTTEMCKSLDGQKFYVHDWNEFYRYSKTNDSTVKYRCYGLITGLNCPPINDGFHWCRSTIIYLSPLENESKTGYNIVDYIRKNKYTNNKNLDTEIKSAIKLLPGNIKTLIKDTKIKISNNNSCYDRNNDTIYLLSDSNKYEVLHEIGHAIETKLDILHDEEYIKIQKKGLENINILTDTKNIKYYQDNMFLKDTGKFISEYQRRIYDNDIDNNNIINYNTYSFNSRTLGEYFSEGFRCYFEENKLLKRKDIDLYNYIREVLK